MPSILAPYMSIEELEQEGFLPYQRDENLVRKWVKPGTPNKQHRIGGLEKELDTGNVSYDPDNHQEMTNIRAEKVALIAKFIPRQEFLVGEQSGDLLLVGWGNTTGVIQSTVKELIKEGKKASQIQIDFIHPFPENLGDMFSTFKQIIVPELNSGQLIKLLKLTYPKNSFVGINKVKGVPFKKQELLEFSQKCLKGGLDD
jgi:2-oxoglutarate ferredoxin oxidoreductase subunit alpha